MVASIQGGVWNFFLIGQNRLTNQRSGMILEVQIRSFGARQSFHFQKIPGGLNINIFFENWYKASFYNKVQKQKYKFEIRLLKSTILDPQKVRFWVLKKTSPKN